MTDDQGRYTIVDLRPGMYNVTFTLSGFNTYRQEGARAAGEFTDDGQRRDAQGALEEPSRSPAPRRCGRPEHAAQQVV